MAETGILQVSGIALPEVGRPGPAGEAYPHREFEQPVPFSEFVNLAPPVEIAREQLEAGLAAEFTTRIDNPVFRLPTPSDERGGAVPATFAMYAPYYLGTGFTPEQIARDVAEHGYDGYVGRVMSVLRSGRVALRGLQGIEDRNILMDVHDFMATITERLHHIAPVTVAGGRRYSVAEAYRDETHGMVDPFVRTVDYLDTPEGYRERFVLPEYIRSDPSQLVALGWDFFPSGALRRGALFAALAAEKLGEPLVRASVSGLYLPPYVRRREYAAAAR
jgi:hypothetical protein